VIRDILVPAAMILLGDDRHWYRGGWLCWIPGQLAEPARGTAEQPAALTGTTRRLS